MSTTGRALVLALLFLAPAGTAAAAPAASASRADRLRIANDLFFDRKYAEARAAWQALRRPAGVADPDAATYWVARSSEKLGEDERALREYGEFLAQPTPPRAFAEEARTSRVSLAARLHKAGKTQHLPVLTAALRDSSRTVRYFAALQLAGLGADVGRPAVPVLQAILKDEKDADLVERAKIALLRVDPSSLGTAAARAPRAAAPAGTRPARWIKVRITEKGGSSPKVAVSVPFALAELVFKSLPDEAMHDLRAKGYNAENFWEQLKAMGPTDVIEIEGDEGEHIRIWLE